MPPVGTNFTEPNGAARASSMAVPPAAPAGKNFSTSRPRARPLATPSGLTTPGSTGTPRSWQQATTPSTKHGLTMNFAPAPMARAAWSAESTVPAPTSSSGSSSAMARMASSAAAVRKVTSATGMPPLTRARPSPTALAADSSLITGTRPISPTRLSSGSMAIPSDQSLTPGMAK